MIQYPVPEAVERIRGLTHPDDLAEVLQAVSAQVERLHNGSDDVEVVQLTHGALGSIETAVAWLARVADEMPDADFEKAAHVGRIRQDIFATMRAVA